MYLGILSKLLLLLIVLNYSYAKMYNTDLLDMVIKNQTVWNVFNIGLIILALYYLFNRDFFLPFLGPAVIPTPQLIQKAKGDEKLVDVELTKLPPNTHIIFWASGESDKDYEDPLGAYKNYENSGIALTDKYGVANIKVACPGRYYINKFGLKRQKLQRHLHYRYELPYYKGLFSRVLTHYIDTC